MFQCVLPYWLAVLLAAQGLVPMVMAERTRQLSLPMEVEVDIAAQVDIWPEHLKYQRQQTKQKVCDTVGLC